MDRIISMVLRMVMSKILNKGISKGFDMATRKKNARDDDIGQGGKGQNPNAQKARQMGKIAKRMGRF